MRKYVTGCLLFLLIGSAVSGENNADNWTIVSSKEGYWIKTVNAEKHELLVAYREDEPQFLLILKTDRPSPGKALPISIRIDSGPKQAARLRFLDKRDEQSIFRIEVNENDKNTYLSQMIAGLNMAIDFDFLSKQSASRDRNIADTVSFTLRGFTFALNDLLIANEIGSLNSEWLLRHNKDRELYCLLTTNINVEVLQYRLRGESFNNVLHLIEKTGYSIIDHNLSDIIEQVYRIPKESLPYVPRAEKYLIFTNCMAQPFHLP